VPAVQFHPTASAYEWALEDLPGWSSELVNLNHDSTTSCPNTKTR